MSSTNAPPCRDKTHDLLTTDEAAAYLKLSRSTLERYRTRGTPKLPFVKLGGCRGPVFYRLSDLEAFVASSVRTSTRQASK